MRALCLLASASVAVALLISPMVANAETMDPALERLVLNPACHSIDTGTGGLANFGTWNPTGGGGTDGRCLADHGAFAKLVNQFGAALAPTAMHVARTTGFGGIELSFEGSFTNLDKDAEYMKNGTRGSIDPNTSRRSIRNNSVDSMAQLYYLKMRKGFPFGLELIGMGGTMANTSFVVLGADVRWALLEGFRKGFLGYIPDVAAGGAVRTITGSSQLQLTTVAVDAQISKPFAIASSSVLTPYVGYQHLWIFGDSGMIDTTPNTDPAAYCGYQGPSVPGTPGAPVKSGDTTRPYDGQPVCTDGKSPLDFNNTITFNAVRLQRPRLVAGLNYRFEMITVGFQFLTDLVKAETANEGKNVEGAPIQYTISASLGAIF